MLHQGVASLRGNSFLYEKSIQATYGGANNSWSLTSGRYCGLQIAAELAE